jgi:glycosyltransferase involved in cell wall biosynthesis
MLLANSMTADARVAREASALADAGHDVVVLALRATGSPDEERIDGYAIRRVADYTTAGWRRPWRKLGQMRARTRAFVDAAMSMGPDVVHANDSDTLAAGSMAATRTCAALLYDAHELYPDMLQEHGIRGSAPVQAYWRDLEARLVPKADAVITVSDGLASELRRRYAVEPIVVMNVPRVQPLAPRGRLRSELGLAPETPLVLYQGVLIQGRGLVGLVEAVASLPGVVLVVQGSGPEEVPMRQRVEALGVGDRIHLTGHQPLSTLHEYACDADVGVVIYEPTTLNNRLAAPNKLFAYLMAGLPVAGSDFPGLAAIVAGEGVGAVFDPTSPVSVASAISGLLGDPERLAGMRARARVLAESRYNWGIEKEKFLAVYRRLEDLRGRGISR